jgi:hypothetical protein
LPSPRRSPPLVPPADPPPRPTWEPTPWEVPPSPPKRRPGRSGPARCVAGEIGWQIDHLSAAREVCSAPTPARRHRRRAASPHRRSAVRGRLVAGRQGQRYLGSEPAWSTRAGDPHPSGRPRSGTAAAPAGEPNLPSVERGRQFVEARSRRLIVLYEEGPTVKCRAVAPRRLCSVLYGLL